MLTTIEVFFKIVLQIFYTSSVRYRKARYQPNDADSIIIKSYQVIRYRVMSRYTEVRDFITWPPPFCGDVTSRSSQLSTSWLFSKFIIRAWIPNILARDLFLSSVTLVVVWILRLADINTNVFRRKVHFVNYYNIYVFKFGYRVIRNKLELSFLLYPKTLYLCKIVMRVCLFVHRSQERVFK